MFVQANSFGPHRARHAAGGAVRVAPWLVAMLCTACTPRSVPEDSDAATDDLSPEPPANTSSGGQETAGEPGTSGTTGAPGPTTGAPAPDSTGGDAEPGTGDPASTGTTTTGEEHATTEDEEDEALIPAMPGPDPLPAPDPLCGDGVLDPGEGCDDGNIVHGDGCLPDCTPGVGATLPPVWTQAPPSWAEHLGLIDGALLGSAADALVVGGQTYEGPMRLEGAPLGDGGPAPWSHVEGEDRPVTGMAIASNGDIIAAGPDYSVQPHALWLARFAPTGDLLWSGSHAPPLNDTSYYAEIDLSPNGDIVVKVQSGVLVFDAAGASRWTITAPVPDPLPYGSSVEYESVTVDEQGRIYAARAHWNYDHAYVVLEAFGPNGDLLWQSGLNSLQYSHTEQPVVAVTPEGTLFVVTRNDDWGSELRTESIAAFDTVGSLRWWRQLSVPYEEGSTGPKHVVPAPWGGIFVVWVRANDDSADCGMVRYNAEGMALYGLGQAMGWVTDFRAGPDGRYYSLEQSQWDDDDGRVVVPHLP